MKANRQTVCAQQDALPHKEFQREEAERAEAHLLMIRRNSDPAAEDTPHS